MHAVQKDGLVLQYASCTLQSDYSIVTAAVSDMGHALTFASEHLQADRDIVMKAVSNQVSSLVWAAEPLKEELFHYACLLQPGLIGLKVFLMSGRHAIVVFWKGPNLRGLWMRASPRKHNSLLLVKIKDARNLFWHVTLLLFACTAMQKYTITKQQS